MLTQTSPFSAVSFIDLKLGKEGASASLYWENLANNLGGNVDGEREKTDAPITEPSTESHFPVPRLEMGSTEASPAFHRGVSLVGSIRTALIFLGF